MTQAAADASFAGSLPTIYQKFLVPLTFEPYAADLAKRLMRRPLRRVLEVAALAYCQGTPVRNEVEAWNPGGLARSTARAAEAVRRQFGASAVEGKLQAHVVEVEK